MTNDLYRLSTLDNGLRVVSEAMPHLETASVGVWVDVGTRHEPAEVNGVAHLLEHMAFKGTTTRSARAIAEEIERVGGSLNAYTSREHTAYFARILAGDIGLAADILADILQRSTFEEAELEKERHVVLQEIGEVKDTPDDLVFDLLQEACYPDQPMGRAILGPEEIVAAMPRQALLDYMRRHYGPDRLVLSAAGKVDHDRLVELAACLFGDLPPAVGGPAAPARYRGGEIRVERRPDLEQVHICLAIEGVAYDDPDHYTLQVLSTALGGGMSSRLFQEAREERGLCYSIFSFAAAHADTGTLGVYAGTDPADVGDLVKVVADATRGLLEDPGEEELARARAQLKAGLFMGRESCAAVSEELARQLLCFGRRIEPAELVARIEAVDAAAVRRLGSRLLSRHAVTVASVGPLTKLPRIDLAALAA